MKRSAPGTYPTYKQASKRQNRTPYKRPKVQRQAASVAPGEMKYFDSDYNGGAIAAVTTTWVAGTSADPLTTINLGSAAVANPLCLIAPITGSALNQRVGRKISVRKIRCNMTVSVAAQAAQAVADTSCKVRLILVQDMQTNAGQMTGAQLFNDGTGAATVINSYQNPNNFGRFRVIKDKMLTISNLNVAGVPGSTDVIQASYRVNLKWNVNFKAPIDCHFNATNGGTVLDIVDNSFHILAATDSTAYVPTLSYYARVAYKDI